MTVNPAEKKTTIVAPRPHWWSLSRWRSMRRFSLADWSPAINKLTEGQQLYVKLRWIDSIQLMESRHGRDVLRFFVLRTFSVLGGVAITALSGIGLSGTNTSGAIRWTIFTLGFLVAGSAGMEQLGQYGAHRMFSRMAREGLYTAGSDYLLPKPDPDNNEAFEAFRGSVEQILEDYNDKYSKTLTS